MELTIVLVRWGRVAAKCMDTPDIYARRELLIKKLPFIGRHVAYLIKSLIQNYHYDAFNIELVTDNIGAHIAHESMLYSYRLYSHNTLQISQLISFKCLIQ